MTSLTCADILAGRAPKDSPVTIKGWVRTRRDSKGAGISFVNLSDGSCFHPVQVVAPNTLPNYSDEVLHLTAGCAVEATGTIVPRRRRDSPSRCRRARSRSSAGSRTGLTPFSPSRTPSNSCATSPICGRAPASSPRSRACVTVAQAIHRYLHDNGFVWVNTPIITSSDAEGAGSCSASRRST